MRLRSWYTVCSLVAAHVASTSGTSEGTLCQGAQCHNNETAALLQLSLDRRAHVDESLRTKRLLANIPAYPAFVLRPTSMQGASERDLTMHVQSVVPVFPPEGEAYMAVIAGHVRSSTSDMVEDAAVDMKCTSPDLPGFSSKVIVSTGNSSCCSWQVVFKCAWPEELRDRPCHSVALVSGGVQLGQYQTCHDPALMKESRFGMAACVTHVYGFGLMMLPQWMEYNVQKGVEHFLVYTTLNETDDKEFAILRPYLDAGMVTLVRLDLKFRDVKDYTRSQAIHMNDCLHRMKGRAEWLLPTIDVDEYLVFNSSERARAMGFPEALREALSRAPSTHPVYAVSFGRTDFLHPADPYRQLQIDSSSRSSDVPNKRLCPKYFVRPELVDSLFVHWPMGHTPGSKNVLFNARDLIAFHYRLSESEEDMVTDRTLASQSEALGRALATRHGKTWPTLGPSLRALSPMALVQPEPKDEDDEDGEIAAEAARLFGEAALATSPTFIDGAM
mmetsp:Transcript_101649/g.294171  ORF Transcript_101649/g.294171 Transcript_101649/m.294171 type:complete len:501 (-) Transcript_101649:122-1624(-)